MAQVGVTPKVQLSTVNGVPHVVNPNENEFQHEAHFLTFIGSFIPETAASEAAYYAALDPNNTKPTFPQWLVNAGFISNVNQWHSFGKQKIACGLGPVNGCDYPAGTYGDNIINTDSHAIVLNAADLGFVRNQFIRCVDPANPKSTSGCTAANPIIYTYLENYPVSPFTGATNGSGFPAKSGYPHDDEGTAAINSAITRPSGIAGRFADVAFEWAPPATNPTSSTRFGQLYAYEVGTDIDANGNVPETLNFRRLDVNKPIINFKAGDGSTNTTTATDKFAPNLDGVGFKYHPGNCLICHGGKPTNLTSTGTYPRQGNINGFRFLPLDIRNLLFTKDGGPLTVDAQQAQVKEYNKVVLLTVPKYAETDDQGTRRVAHLREVILGWYAGFPGDTTMSSPTQNGDFLPIGWREPAHGGTAPAGAEDLYHKVVGPSCRSCHFNRELSLDFGTYANFHQESDLQQLSFLGQCKQDNNADPNAKFMPLALLTFVRAWETQTGPRTLGDGTVLDHVVDKLAADFGYGSPNGVNNYCATNP